MEIYISENGSIEELEIGLKKISAISSVHSILILACDKNGFTPQNCDSILNNIKKPLFGGIFPSILHNNKRLEKGTLILGFKFETTSHIIRDISNNETDFEASVEDFIENRPETKTISLIVDGFSKRISALIDALFIVYGLDYSFIGGGAGSLSMEQNPCLFTNEGLLMDSAIVTEIQAECGIGVQHGWKSISGPFKITSSDCNIIKTIDFKPAFEVYKQIVDEHSGKDMKQDNFFDIAKAYPFGINKLDAEKVVRDPISTHDNCLVCVGEVPEGAFFDILHGNKPALINAAKIAAENSRKDISEQEIDFVLFFDCISRVLFLEDDFYKELKAVEMEKTPLIGALSIGEIANNKKDYLDFYNKTAVVATVKKQ